MLFNGETVLGSALTEAIAAAPAGLDPLGDLLLAFEATVPLLAAALKARGVADLSASLAARIGMDAFTLATTARLEDLNPTLGERLAATWSELEALLGRTTG